MSTVTETIDEHWLEDHPEVQPLLSDFCKQAIEVLPLLKVYVATIAEICDQLQKWIDDLKVQEVSVNTVNTATTAGSVISTGLLFTPLAPFGVYGLIGTSVGAALTSLGDGVSNNIMGNKIQNLVQSKTYLIQKTGKETDKIEALIKKVSDVGNISFSSAGSLCFGLASVACKGAEARALTEGEKMFQLMVLFRAGRAGQLAPGGWNTIRGLTGAVSKTVSFLQAVIGIWMTVDGWINGNPTRNSAIKTKKNFEESVAAISQMIELIEGIKQK